MSSLKILIVDDNRVDRYMLNRYLSKTGIDISTDEADDGSTALSYLSECLAKDDTETSNSTPHIIFLDINMTLIGGWEFLDKFAVLKQGTPLETCSVVMYTSSETGEDMDKIRDHNFVKGYVVKGSLSVSELKDKVEQVAAH